MEGTVQVSFDGAGGGPRWAFLDSQRKEIRLHPLSLNGTASPSPEATGPTQQPARPASLPTASPRADVPGGVVAEDCTVVPLAGVSVVKDLPSLSLSLTWTASTTPAEACGRRWTKVVLGTGSEECLDSWAEAVEDCAASCFSITQGATYASPALRPHPSRPHDPCPLPPLPPPKGAGNVVAAGTGTVFTQSCAPAGQTEEGAGGRATPLMGRRRRKELTKSVILETLHNKSSAGEGTADSAALCDYLCGFLAMSPRVEGKDADAGLALGTAVPREERAAHPASSSSATVADAPQEKQVWTKRVQSTAKHAMETVAHAAQQRLAFSGSTTAASASPNGSTGCCMTSSGPSPRPSSVDTVVLRTVSEGGSHSPTSSNSAVVVVAPASQAAPPAAACPQTPAASSWKVEVKKLQTQQQQFGSHRDKVTTPSTPPSQIALPPPLPLPPSLAPLNGSGGTSLPSPVPATAATCAAPAAPAAPVVSSSGSKSGLLHLRSQRKKKTAAAAAAASSVTSSPTVDLMGSPTVTPRHKKAEARLSAYLSQTPASVPREDFVPEDDVPFVLGKTMPFSLVLYIFTFLSPRDLCRACQVSKLWNRISSSQSLWATFCYTLGLTLGNQSGTYRDMYRDFRLEFSDAQARERMFLMMLTSPHRVSRQGCGYCGWGYKRGEDLFKTWKRRWLVVWNNCLCYFKSRKPEERPCGLIALDGHIRVRKIKKSCFLISSATGVLSSVKLASSEDGSSEGTGTAEVPVLKHKGRGDAYISTEKEYECNVWMAAVCTNAFLSTELLSGAGEEEIPRRVPLFGVPLEKVSQGDGSCPEFLRRIIDRICSRWLDEEGLFRLSGDSENILAVKTTLESGGEIDLTKVECHVLTSLVKLWLRELPQPLVPPHINSWTNQLIAQTSFAEDGKVPDDVLDEVRDSLRELPLPALNLLRELVAFFNRIVDHAASNKMTQNNLFIVLIPTLRCAPSLLALAMAFPERVFSPAVS